jgi:hypothetical protein
VLLYRIQSLKKHKSSIRKNYYKIRYILGLTEFLYIYKRLLSAKEITYIKKSERKGRRKREFIENQPFFVAKLTNKTLDSDYRDLMGAMVEAQQGPRSATGSIYRL